MAEEIERKFLVDPDHWPRDTPGISYRQGYILSGPPTSVRIRIKGNTANLNIKKLLSDTTRAEYEYPIPLKDAHEMLDSLCTQGIVEKTRHVIPYAGHTWEVDVFGDANQGLVIAEIELPHEDTPFAPPPWVTQEVTSDPRYLNASLAQHPYNTWKA